MLDKNNVEELIKIVATANGYMDGEGIPEYSIIAVQWDDESMSWQVVYHSDYGIDYTTVYVNYKGNDYTVSGHTGGSTWEPGHH